MKALKLSGITFPGAGYPVLNDFLYVPPPVLPVTTNLVGLYTAGYSDAQTLRNYANSAKPLTKVGAPVVTAGQIGALTNAPTNRYDTGIPSSADLTLMLVAKLIKPATDAAGWLGISNFNSTANVGSDSLGFGGPGGVASAQVNGGKVNTSNVLTSTPVAGGNVGEYNVLFGRIRNNGQCRVWWSKSAVVTAPAETAVATRYVQALNLQVGGHMSTGGLFAANNTILCAGIFQGALSDADVAANLAYLSGTWGPSVGIATL